MKTYYIPATKKEGVWILGSRDHIASDLFPGTQISKFDTLEKAKAIIEGKVNFWQKEIEKHQENLSRVRSGQKGIKRLLDEESKEIKNIIKKIEFAKSCKDSFLNPKYFLVSVGISIYVGDEVK